MRSYSSLKPVKCVAKIDFLYKPLVDENTKIAIHRPHAQFGKLGLQLIVQPIRGWVYAGVLQYC